MSQESPGWYDDAWMGREPASADDDPKDGALCFFHGTVGVVELQEDPKSMDAERAFCDLMAPRDGEFEGTNDANDAPWRIAAEKALAEIFDDGLAELDLCDVHWDYGVLRVACEQPGGESPTSEQLAAAARIIVNRFEEPHLAKLGIMERHTLELTSKGASDVLTMQKEFDAFRGFDVDVSTNNPIQGGKPRTMSGRLVEKNVLDLVINMKGRIVKVPYHLVDEVRLPQAKEEK